MDLSIAGIALQQVRTKCSEYYETAKTQVQAFCSDVEKHDVYQCVMSKVKGLGEDARALFVSIFSRKTTGSVTTGSIRGKHGLDDQGESTCGNGFAENIRANAEQRRAEREALLGKFQPIKVFDSMADLHESIEGLQGHLITQSLTTQGKEKKLVQQKMALLGDIAQFKERREQSMDMDSKGLANDLYVCRTHKELVQRLERKDVPVMVGNELKAKLNKV